MVQKNYIIAGGRRKYIIVSYEKDLILLIFAVPTITKTQ